MIDRALSCGIITTEGKLNKGDTFGTPQGSILSPLLANVVLDKLDKYMESLKDELNVGTKRKTLKETERLNNERKHYKIKDPARAHAALLRLREIPRYDMSDSSYKRAIYIRYADDFLVLLSAPLTEVKALRNKISLFLHEECGLKINPEKTTITNTRDGFMFLGAIIKRRDNSSIYKKYKSRSKKITRRTTLRMGVNMPTKLIIEKLIRNKYARRNHLGIVLAKGRTDLIHLTHYDILKFFNSKITGILNAYSFAGNYASLHHIT